MTIEEIEIKTAAVLTPILCKFCNNYVTYIEFDFLLYLSESHRIGWGYIDTPPVPSVPSRSWSDEPRIRDIINDVRFYIK